MMRRLDFAPGQYFVSNPFRPRLPVGFFAAR